MRFRVSLLIGFVLCSCRTIKDDDTRHFAKAEKSNDGIAGVKVQQVPERQPPEPPPAPFPKPGDPLESGAFYRVCRAKDQLVSEQALTVQALLAGVHTQDCVEGERWLRDSRNQSLMLESQPLVELKTLQLLQNYPHIRNVYITLAKGVQPLCPLASPQNCHFKVAEF